VLSSTLPDLLSRFLATTSNPGLAEADLCQGLQPFVQVLAEASPDELSDTAKPVDDETKFWLSFGNIRAPARRGRVDACYLTHIPGTFHVPTTARFNQMRQIRARVAWLHSDLEVLLHLSLLLGRGQVVENQVSEYMIQLVRGLTNISQ